MQRAFEGAEEHQKFTDEAIGAWHRDRGEGGAREGVRRRRDRDPQQEGCGRDRQPREEVRARGQGAGLGSRALR